MFTKLESFSNEVCTKPKPTAVGPGCVPVLVASQAWWSQPRTLPCLWRLTSPTRVLHVNFCEAFIHAVLCGAI